MCNNLPMSARNIQIENEQGLAAIAAKIAPLLRAGDTITLQGDLGAGKTAFTRALVNEMASGEEEVPSPTFTLVQTYDLPQFTLWHFDLYRIENQQDIMELGWEEVRRGGVAVVEWPERLAQGPYSLLPKDRLEISISFVQGSENSRLLTLTPFGTWQNRLI